jgi:hypothetical protein
LTAAVLEEARVACESQTKEKCFEYCCRVGVAMTETKERRVSLKHIQRLIRMCKNGLTEFDFTTSW